MGHVMSLHPEHVCRGGSVSPCSVLRFTDPVDEEKKGSDRPSAWKPPYTSRGCGVGNDLRATAGLAGSRGKDGKMGACENRRPGSRWPGEAPHWAWTGTELERSEQSWGVWPPQVLRKCRGGGARGDKGLEAGRRLNSFCLLGCCLLWRLSWGGGACTPCEEQCWAWAW